MKFYQVYFARRFLSNAVKIGITTYTLAARLELIPPKERKKRPLRILYAIPVSRRSAEKWFHRRFKKKLIEKREWFDVTTWEIKCAIQAYQREQRRNLRRSRSSRVLNVPVGAFFDRKTA